VIIVVGDVMVDEYVHVEVRKQSPEAPEATVFGVNRVEVRPGGAANVAENVKSLGEEAALIGVVGPDNYSRCIRTADGLLRVLPDRPTTVKTRLIVANKQIARIDNESMQSIDPRTSADILLKVAALMESRPNQQHVIVISDYNKGVCTDYICRELIKLASALGAKVIVDPKKLNWDPYYGATVICPNMKEYATHSWSVYLKHRPPVLITKGSSGMRLIYGEVKYDIGAVPTHCEDPTGAGDTVVAAMAVHLLHSDNLVDAAEYANRAAARAVSNFGTYAVGEDEV
jgi:rfaE bifunctional protein kinase chain/domain